MAAKHPAVSAAIAAAIGYPEERGASSRLAEKLGRNPSIVNRWARGESSPDPADWRQIESALNMSEGKLKQLATERAARVDPASQPDDELRRRIESLERELTNQTAALAALAHGVAENRAKANNAAAAMLDRLTRLEQTAGL